MQLSSTLFCCAGVAGCDFQHWNDEQRLENTSKICEKHGAELVARVAKADGIGEVNFRDALEAAGVEVIPDKKSFGGTRPLIPPGAQLTKKARGGPEALADHWQEAARTAPHVALPLCLTPSELKQRMGPEGDKLNVALPSPSGPLVDGCLRNVINGRLGEWSRDMMKYATFGSDGNAIEHVGLLTFNNAKAEEATAKILGYAEHAQARRIRLEATLTAPAVPGIDYLSAPLTDEEAAAIVAEADCGDLQLSKHPTFTLYFPRSADLPDQVQHHTHCPPTQHAPTDR